MPHPIEIMLAQAYKTHTRKTPAMCVSHRGHLGRIDIDVRILNIGTKGAVTGWSEDAIASFFGRDRVGLEPAEPTQRVAFPGILLLLARQEK